MTINYFKRSLRTLFGLFIICYTVYSMEKDNEKILNVTSLIDADVDQTELSTKTQDINNYINSGWKLLSYSEAPYNYGLFFQSNDLETFIFITNYKNIKKIIEMNKRNKKEYGAIYNILIDLNPKITMINDYIISLNFDDCMVFFFIDDNRLLWKIFNYNISKLTLIETECYTVDFSNFIAKFTNTEIKETNYIDLRNQLIISKSDIMNNWGLLSINRWQFYIYTEVDSYNKSKIKYYNTNTK